MPFSHAVNIGLIAAGIAGAIGFVGMLSLAGALYYVGRKYYDSAKKLMEETEKKSVEADKDIAARTNRIAGLDPDKLEQYLIRGFARCLEFSSAADVSGNDHNAIEKLYAAAWIRFVDPANGYLTPETESAIVRLYGKDYISRTCSSWFLLAHQRGLITELVRRKTTSDEILRRYAK